MEKHGKHYGSYVAYYRVSTDKQKRSGLGLDAQREAVANYLNGGRHRLVAEFTERESGKRTDRPQLEAALAMCRARRAVLVVAKLDRLARNARFLLALVESGEGVVFCDLPSIPEGPTGKFLLASMANVAELEAGLISQRTKAALKAAKDRGTVLGRPDSDIARYAKRGAKASASVRSAKARQLVADLAPVIAEIRRAGANSLPQIAAGLNERNIPSPRGGVWHPTTVQRLGL